MPMPATHPRRWAARASQNTTAQTKRGFEVARHCPSTTRTPVPRAPRSSRDQDQLHTSRWTPQKGNPCNSGHCCCTPSLFLPNAGCSERGVPAGSVLNPDVFWGTRDVPRLCVPSRAGDCHLLTPRLLNQRETWAREGALQPCHPYPEEEAVILTSPVWGTNEIC